MRVICVFKFKSLESEHSELPTAKTYLMHIKFNTGFILVLVRSILVVLILVPCEILKMYFLSNDIDVKLENE